MRLRRGLVVLSVIGLLVAGFGVADTAPAHADPPTDLNSAAIFALNVPGSVLADAAPVDGSGASLAAGHTFSWEYAAPAFALVSGTLTPTPVAPDVVLTPAERALWAEIVAGQRGTAATKIGNLIKTPAGSAALVVTSYAIGAQIGNETVKLLGLDADGLVCGAAEGLGQVALSLLTGADCTQFNEILAAFPANSDVSPDVDAGQSCTLAGVCLTFQLERLVQYTTPYGSGTPTQWKSDRFWCFTQSSTSVPSYVSYLTSSGTFYQTGANAWTTTIKPYKYFPEYCGGNRWLPIGTSSSAAPYPEFADVPVAWIFNPTGTAAETLACLQGTGSCGGRTATIPEVTVADITRTLVCEILGTDDVVYTAESAEFTEGSGTLPAIVCPELPAGVTAVTVTVTEVGGDISNVLYQRDVTDAYTDWWEAYPECTNGSCLLDLRQGSDSCFQDGVDCEGWFSDPNRNSVYTCRYGTHTISLGECFVYAATFEAGPQADGHAYADPMTGDSIAPPTSPTEVDRLTRTLLERGWLTHGPTPGDFRYGYAADDPAPFAAARAVALQCIDLGVAEECEDMPIFAPGDNVREAAQHDLDAITLVNSAWVQLNRSTSPPVGDGWYASTPPCVTGTYVGSTHQCDEYPFQSTSQAGPGASLRVIDGPDNVNEGGYLSLFYTQCGVGDGEPYLVLPIPTQPPLPRSTATAAWC